MQLHGVAGSSVAARAIGRNSLAELTLTERAPPQRVARLFIMSAAKDTAVILHSFCCPVLMHKADGGPT
jgi:hypothetical protein